MKKMLLLLIAAALWNCTDYAADWDSKYENAFAANGENRICMEGETTIINQNDCVTGFVCLNNSWVVASGPQCQIASAQVCVEGSATALVAGNCVVNYVCSNNAWVQYGDLQCVEVSAPKVCDEGEEVSLSENNCIYSYVCSANAWVLLGEPECKNESSSDYLTDSRDGQKYKIVKIGSQVWMAENLKYAASGSSCYGGVASNCDKYGCLYTQNAAKQACPSGWHLPSKAEWEKLLSVNGSCKALRKNGTDLYGFSALQSGSSANAPGSYAIFWASTSGMDVNLGNSSGGYCGVYSAVSGEKIPVRCIKD